VVLRVQFVLLVRALVGCACQIWDAVVRACHTQRVPALAVAGGAFVVCHRKR